APQLGGVDDRRQEALALLLGAEGDDRGPDQALAEEAHARRRLGPGVLLVEHDLLGERCTSAAVLLRPADARPSVGRQVALPRQADVETLVLLAAGAAQPPRLGEVACEVVVEPVAHLAPEGFVLVGEPEIHLRRTPGARAAGT